VTASELRIEQGRAAEPPGTDLIAATLREGDERYGAEDEPDGFAADQLAAPDGVFLLAWRGRSAVGCGGIRRRADFDDATGEIKRMYVAPEARQQGVARVILRELEAAAVQLGYRRLVLETGTKQPEALALYQGAGYERIEPYGLYKDSPLTRCFAKELEASATRKRAK
jgi:GNAT superfamily N-acetyltransferase